MRLLFHVHVYLMIWLLKIEAVSYKQFWLGGEWFPLIGYFMLDGISPSVFCSTHVVSVTGVILSYLTSVDRDRQIFRESIHKGLSGNKIHLNIDTNEYHSSGKMELETGFLFRCCYGMVSYSCPNFVSLHLIQIIRRRLNIG